MVLLQNTLFGGTGGSYFDDHNENITGIVGMRIRAGSYVDSIQVTYRLKDGSTFAAPMHGGTGGSEYSFTLANGEKLTRMEGMTNGMLILFVLTFYSNLNNVYGPYIWVIWSNAIFCRCRGNRGNLWTCWKLSGWH